jgi:excisionase family DNA binding protein
MPHRTLELEEVARHLHLSSADVVRLVKDQEIPFERHGNRLIFRKVEIDVWASQRLLGLQGRRLLDYHRQTAQRAREVLAHPAILPDLIQPDFIEPKLPAKTKASVLREMVALADRTGRVWDLPGLLAGLQGREELCSTGLPGGLALLHTRHPDPYLFESVFLVLGRTVQPIPFGAPDGQATDLFFLIACPDDRLHLHTLARLCCLVQKTEALVSLRLAPDAETMYQCLLQAETEVIEKL